MLLNYTDKGTGPVLVLIHGLLGSLDNLNMVARSFNKNYRTISLDLRNHGSSPHHDVMDYQSIADDIIETLNALSINTFYLLGHSMGGKAAMIVALQHPERVKKLIVADIAPVTYPERHNEIFLGLKNITLSTIKNRSEADTQLAAYVKEPSVRQFLLRNLSKGTENFTWKMNLLNIINNYSHVIGFPDCDQHYPSNCLFIKGGNSDYISMAHQNVILKLFPKAQAKVIQGAGHWLHAEKTIIFNKIVANFLQTD